MGARQHREVRDTDERQAQPEWHGQQPLAGLAHDRERRDHADVAGGDSETLPQPLVVVVGWLVGNRQQPIEERR
jgi:hypothetical protein